MRSAIICTEHHWHIRSIRKNLTRCKTFFWGGGQSCRREIKFEQAWKRSNAYDDSTYHELLQPPLSRFVKLYYKDAKNVADSHMFAQVIVANWKSTMKLQGQYFHCKFGWLCGRNSLIYRIAGNFRMVQIFALFAPVLISRK